MADNRTKLEKVIAKASALQARVNAWAEAEKKMPHEGPDWPAFLQASMAQGQALQAVPFTDADADLEV